MGGNLVIDEAGVSGQPAIGNRIDGSFCGGSSVTDIPERFSSPLS